LTIIAPGRARQTRPRAEYSATAGGGVILVARISAGAVLNYAFGLGLAWLLVPASFGLVSAVQNVLLLAAGLLNAGLPRALASRVTKAHRDREAAKPEFRTALIANLGLGLGLGAAFLAAQLAGPRLVPTGSAVIDLTVAAEMVMLALNGTLAGVAQGSGRSGGLGAMQGGEIVLKCAAAAVLVAGLQAGPAGVALSFLLGTAGSVLIGLRTCRGLLPGPGPLASFGFLAGSGSIWFASASMSFLITADLLGLEVAGRTAGATVAVLASYQACGLLARASFYVSDALGGAFFPFIARGASPRGRHRWFVAGARWVLLIIPVQAALFAAPGPVLRLFLPHQYSGPAADALLRVLAAGTLAALITDMFVKSLFAADRGRQAGRLMPIIVVTEVAGLIVLVPRYGAVGAACSYLLASGVGVIILMPLYLRTVRARLPSASKLAGYAIGFAPTAAMFAAAGRAPVRLAWAPWALITAGALAFVPPARRMRLITDADIRFLKDLISRGWRTARRTDVWLALFCTCVAAAALLYHISTSPDVLYDEASSTFAAQQLAQGWHLTLDHQPVFLLQGAWLHITGHASGPLASAIPAARLLAASFGVADVLLIAALVFRLAGGADPRQRRVVTAMAAVIAALDPVLTRYDRQDVIEPFALCVGLVTLHAAWGLRDRRALTYISVTGLLGGLALMTDEITICLVAVPPLFALLERDRPLIRRSLAALGIAVAFLLWAAELGLVRITGLNVPGVSLANAVGRSAGHYASSYIVLLAGFAAALWCWSARNTTSGNFLTAWLTASYGAAAYMVAAGRLDEQFIVYLLPASITGTVLGAAALVTSWGRRRARSRPGHGRRRAGPACLPLAVVAVAGTALAGLSAAGWVASYASVSDGVVLATRFIATALPPCAAVNASGDPGKYSYLLPSHPITYFPGGAAALADGVHYFLLSPVDGIEQAGDMSPVLAGWIAGSGQRLATFPSDVYGTVQLWHVPASPYDPAADVVNIPGGVYINTAGSRCGGYTVTDGPRSLFYSAYQSRGSKQVLGDPLSRPGSGPDGRDQLFDGMVLAVSRTGSPAVRALPVVAMLAKDSPAAYRRAKLPPVDLHASAATRRYWLTNTAITHAYLDGARLTERGYAAAVQRYGEPLGPPVSVPGAGVRQAFADAVLQAPPGGGSVRTVAVTPVALAAGVLYLPPRALVPQPPPPLPEPYPPRPPEPASPEPASAGPTSAVPLVALGATLLLDGAVLARRPGGRS
jgi:O-antigen/teichoic acid export membrane protein